MTCCHLIFFFPCAFTAWLTDFLGATCGYFSWMSGEVIACTWEQHPRERGGVHGHLGCCSQLVFATGQVNFGELTSMRFSANCWSTDRMAKYDCAALSRLDLRLDLTLVKIES
jgi:hypothetical protein